MDHAQSPAKPLGYRLPGKVVQGDEPVRLLHRPHCRTGVGVYELIDVGPAELQDDWSRRKFRFETLDGSGASPSMNRDHRIGRLSIIARCDVHPMAELSEDARPSRRRDAITGA